MPVSPLRLSPNCIFELPQALLSRMAIAAAEGVPQEVKVSFGRFDDVGLVGMQRQSGLSRPLLHDRQGPFGVFTSSTQDHEVIRVPDHLEALLGH